MTSRSFKSRLASLTLVLFAMHAVAAAGGLDQGEKDTRSEKVDELFVQWDKPDSPGCALAVIKDGQVIYKRGYGMANLEHNIPIRSSIDFSLCG